MHEAREAGLDGRGARADRRRTRRTGGFYFAPTLFRDVPPAHRLAQDEVFGPVLAAMSFDDEDDARAPWPTARVFGLVAGVWTRDGSRAMRVAQAHALRPGVRQ